LASIKGPQVNPSSLTELQALWDANTEDFKKACFQTLIDYKTGKTQTLKNVIDKEGDITISLVKSVKTQEQLLISSSDNKTKQNSIKKEALACCIYWANNRKQWVEIGYQQAMEASKANEEKAKAYKDRQESTAYNIAVRTHQYISSNFADENIEQSSSSSWKTKSSISKQQIPPLQLTTEWELPDTSSTKHRHGQRYQQRQRQRQRQSWTYKGKWLQDSEDVIAPSKNRRLPKSKTKTHRLNLTKELMLEYSENIMSLKTTGIITPEIHNISTQNINYQQIQSLALGHKFIPTPKNNPELISDSMEYFRRSTRIKWHFKNEELNEKPEYWIPSTWEPSPNRYNKHIELSLNSLESNLHQMTTYKCNNINKTIKENLTNLLNNPKIMVVTADKNLGYVITDTTWYEKACLDHLLSPSYINVTDEFLQHDEGHTTTISLFNTLTSKVLEYTENFTLTPEEAKWICKNEKFSPSKFYITPKIHKQPVKGRPIVPSMTWITFHLSEWIANQLNPLVLKHCPNVLKDTTQLLQNINIINNNQIDTSQYFVMSADVEALYPNMDIKHGLLLIKQFLTAINWEDNNKINFLLWAMEFTLTKGYISFKEMIFQQTNGAAMGSPMIPPYANIFMHMIEKDTVKEFTDNNLLLLYKRFIDDIFIITQRNLTSINTLKNQLNNIHKDIKLTWTEPANQVDFLDITIKLNLTKSIIDTTIYQKPLNKYSYLPYHSFHTSSMKTGFIKGEAIRYVRSCTKKKDYNRMIQLFTIRLQRRGYPLNLIHKAINSVKYSLRQQYLKQKDHKDQIPYIFKILYTNQINHHFLRKELNIFSHKLKNNIPNLPNSLQQRITICYKLPSTLHKKVLKARKAKGF